MEMMLGPYRVTGTIGCGGMGIVYAAEHALLGRPAAIKVLQSDLSKKQDVVARFFNEARASTAIRHPGIIEVYDFGWTPEGAAYLVMERLEGETLSRRAARVPLHWQEVLAIARQIAGALAAAHAKGIVHRDLKPDNIFLVPDPEVAGSERIKLLDFGIAKLAVDASSTVTVTQTGAVIGTPTYMAPEQCRGVAVDHRADLYSLGCVIYELCCGRPPFRGEGTGDVLAAHIYMPPPAMSAVKPEVPEAVEALVRRLLAKAPGDRLQSAEEVIIAIDAVRGEPTISIDPPVHATPAIPEPVTTALGSAILPAPQVRARLRRWLAAVSAGMVVLVAAVALLAMRAGDDAGTTAMAASAMLVAAPPRREPLVAPVPPPAHEVVAPPPAGPATTDAAIDSAPAGAEVILAGEVLGTTPFRGQIATPDRDAKLVLRLAGHVDRTIALHAGEPIHERVTLARKQPPPAPHVTPAPAAPAKRATAERDRSVNPFD